MISLRLLWRVRKTLSLRSRGRGQKTNLYVCISNSPSTDLPSEVTRHLLESLTTLIKIYLLHWHINPLVDDKSKCVQLEIGNVLWMPNTWSRCSGNMKTLSAFPALLTIGSSVRTWNKSSAKSRQNPQSLWSGLILGYFGSKSGWFLVWSVWMWKRKISYILNAVS